MTTTSTSPRAGTPPAGWYATAEGSHERYWDGETWSAPRRRTVHVITHPKPEPEADKVSMPGHVYRDLPKYATVPPFVVAAEVWHSAFGRSGVPTATHRAGFRGGPRALWTGAGFAWLAALWPALCTFVLLALDVFGSVQLGPQVLWAAYGVWVLLCAADIAVVRRVRSRGPHRPGSASPTRLSWTWALVPPVEILARTRAAHSTRLIPFVLYFAVAFPVVWFMPQEWITSVDSVFTGLSSGASSGIETIMEAAGITT